jgi:predicted alpha/beta hydrolase family esterase
MKAVILHGTSSTPQNNWFQRLKYELEKLGHEVWVPQLPEADLPDIGRYNKFLFESGWDFNNNLIIGHSSGAVEVIGLLQALPENLSINTGILVGVFQKDLGREDLKGMDVTFDFEKIRSKAKQFIVVHSDNDPYCPLDGAKWITQQLNAEFKLFPGYQHFGVSQDPKFKEFPELLEIIREEVNL